MEGKCEKRYQIITYINVLNLHSFHHSLQLLVCRFQSWHLEKRKQIQFVTKYRTNFTIWFPKHESRASLSYNLNGQEIRVQNLDSTYIYKESGPSDKYFVPYLSWGRQQVPIRVHIKLRLSCLELCPLGRYQEKQMFEGENSTTPVLQNRYKVILET